MQELHFTSTSASFPQKKSWLNCKNRPRMSGLGSSSSQDGSTTDSTFSVTAAALCHVGDSKPAALCATSFSSSTCRYRASNKSWSIAHYTHAASTKTCIQKKQLSPDNLKKTKQIYIESVHNHTVYLEHILFPQPVGHIKVRQASSDLCLYFYGADEP